MEIIDINWCKQHNLKLVSVNVATDTSYYLEDGGNVILVYTQSSTGRQSLKLYNPINNKDIELTIKRFNRALSEINHISVSDLHKLCELINLEYPFKQ